MFALILTVPTHLYCALASLSKLLHVHDTNPYYGKTKKSVNDVIFHACVSVHYIQNRSKAIQTVRCAAVRRC